MGRTSSSSKKNSSKSKIPKISSEARRKKKSRKSKSKKIRRRDDSVSSYSDDDLSSSLSVSSSSSDDDYRSRKSRSRTRGDIKGSRKRARRSTSSRDSSLDSPRIKKKKRNRDSESKKKRSKKKKKKRRRDSSISSYSSDSHRKLSDNVCDNTIEIFSVESNPRRLRSVITIVTREMESEGNEENKDEFKEEIVYDHDDYPSSRSNDSYEAGNMRELAHGKKENVITEEPSVTNLEAPDPILTSKNGSDKYDGLECSFDGAGNLSPQEKKSDVKDFELILRQRALENLKRFRGGHQMNEVVPVEEKDKSNNETMPLSNVETELLPNKRAVENQTRFQGGSQINEVVPLDERNQSNNEIKQEGPGIMGASESAVRRSRFTWRRDSSLPTGTEAKIPPKKNSETDSAAMKLTDESLPDSEEKARNVRPVASRLQTLPRENLSLPDSASKSANKRADGATETLAESSDVLAEEGSSREQQNEAKDGSQFEQKKMTVMRGGELVEVSYKVYIPKKAPALARRQLKR